VTFTASHKCRPPLLLRHWAASCLAYEANSPTMGSFIHHCLLPSCPASDVELARLPSLQLSITSVASPSPVDHIDALKNLHHHPHPSGSMADRQSDQGCIDPRVLTHTGSWSEQDPHNDHRGHQGTVCTAASLCSHNIRCGFH
jgi:hypothetical protein